MTADTRGRTNPDSTALPKPAIRDDNSAEFFDALRDGLLVLRLCSACGHRDRPQSAACSVCHQTRCSWVPAAGTGRIVTSVVDHTVPDTPVLVLVELSEGPWIFSRLVEVDASAVVPHAAAVALRVVPTESGEPVPVFILVEQPPTAG